MIKITEKNRSVFFLAGTLISGVLITGIVMLFEGGVGITKGKTANDSAKSNSTSLENKIESLNRENFDPSSYATLATEIDASYKQKLITSSVKTNLESSLIDTYSNLVYKKCELFLIGNSSNTGKEILGLLTHVEKISSSNGIIYHYRDQIKWYEYYSSELPKQVERFIQSGTTEFTYDLYSLYKGKLQSMRELDSKYKSTFKINKMKTDLILRLDNLYILHTDQSNL